MTMPDTDRAPNGPGAAAILAAGAGSAALGVFALASDTWPAINAAFVIWVPTGALSGVTTAAIAVWLVFWLVLARYWAARDVNLGRVNLGAFAMLAMGVLLTFPPLMDMLQGK